MPVIFCHACGQQTLWFWGQEDRHQALEGQVPLKGHHEIARNVKGHPEEIVAFARPTLLTQPYRYVKDLEITYQQVSCLSDAGQGF